jgi:hypothetical protein
MLSSGKSILQSQLYPFWLSNSRELAVSPTYTAVKGSFYLYEVNMNPFEMKSDGSIVRDVAVIQASHIEEAILLNVVASLEDPGCLAND